MNEQALVDSYNIFTSGGYTGSVEDFKQLIANNPNALNDSYNMFKTKGYTGTVNQYQELLGVGKQPDPQQDAADGSGQPASSGDRFVADPTVESYIDQEFWYNIQNEAGVKRDQYAKNEEGQWVLNNEDGTQDLVAEGTDIHTQLEVEERNKETAESAAETMRKESEKEKEFVEQMFLHNGSHITQEELDESMGGVRGFFYGEVDTAKLLRRRYGSGDTDVGFEIEEAAAGSTAFKFTNRINGETAYFGTTMGLMHDDLYNRPNAYALNAEEISKWTQQSYDNALKQEEEGYSEEKIAAHLYRSAKDDKENWDASKKAAAVLGHANVEGKGGVTKIDGAFYYTNVELDFLGNRSYSDKKYATGKEKLEIAQDLDKEARRVVKKYLQENPAARIEMGDLAREDIYEELVNHFEGGLGGKGDKDFKGLHGRKMDGASLKSFIGSGEGNGAFLNAIIEDEQLKFFDEDIKSVLDGESLSDEAYQHKLEHYIKGRSDNDQQVFKNVKEKLPLENELNEIREQLAQGGIYDPKKGKIVRFGSGERQQLKARELELVRQIDVINEKSENAGGWSLWNAGDRDLESHFAEYGMSADAEFKKERAKQMAAGYKNQKATMEADVNDIMERDPNLTTREALIMYHKEIEEEEAALKTIYGEETIEWAFDNEVLLNPDSVNVLEGEYAADKMTLMELRLSRYYHSIGSSLEEEIAKNGYDIRESDGQNRGAGVKFLKIPIAAIKDSGTDSRDFTGWFDSAVHDILSDEDIAKLDDYEMALDNLHGKKSAVFDLAYLDRDPGQIFGGTASGKHIVEDVGSGFATFADRGLKAVKTHWFDYSAREASTSNAAMYGYNPIGGRVGEYTNTDILGKMQEVSADFNRMYQPEISAGKMDAVEFTQEQVDNMTTTMADNIAGGVGDFVPVMVELAALSAVSEGVLGVLGAKRYLNAWKAGNQIIKSGSKVKGTMVLKEVAAAAPRLQKAKYHAAMLALEEAKMQTAGFKPGSGAAFYAMGAATPWLRPGMLPLGVGKRVAQFDQLFQTTVKAGVVGAAASEFAQITELAWEDITGEDDFGIGIDRLYGDMDEVQQRLITNAFVFAFAGNMSPSGLKATRKGLAMATFNKARTVNNIEGKLKRLRVKEEDRGTYDDIQKQRKDLKRKKRKGDIGEAEYQYEMEILEMTESTLDIKTPEQYLNDPKVNKGEMGDYMSLLETGVDLQRLINAQKYAVKFDPSNPEQYKKAIKEIEDNINKQGRKWNKENHQDLEIEVLEKAEVDRMVSEGTWNEGDKAFLNETGDKIFLDRSKMGQDMGVVTQELFHWSLKQAFGGKNGNQRKAIVFKKAIDKAFEESFGYDFNTYMKNSGFTGGRTLGEAVRETYGKEAPKEGETRAENRARRERNFEEQQEEFLANLAEFVARPEVYDTHIANTFFKKAKQRLRTIKEEHVPWMDNKHLPTDAKGIVEFLGRLGADVRTGRSFTAKLNMLPEVLEGVSSLGMEFRESTSPTTQAKRSSKNMEKLREQKAPYIKAIQEGVKNFQEGKITQKQFDAIKETNQAEIQKINAQGSRIPILDPLAREGGKYKMSTEERRDGLKRAERVNATYEGYKDLFTKSKSELTEREVRQVEQAQNAIINSYLEGAVASVIRSGQTKTATFQKMSEKEISEEIMSLTKPEMIKHFERFDPAKNNNLDAYMNSYVARKAQTGIKKIERTEFEGSTDVVKDAPKKEPSYNQNFEAGFVENKSTPSYQIELASPVRNSKGEITGYKTDLQIPKERMPEFEKAMFEVDAVVSKLTAQELASLDIKKIATLFGAGGSQARKNNMKPILDGVFGKTPGQKVQTIGENAKMLQDMRPPSNVITRIGKTEANVEGKSLDLSGSVLTMNISKTGEAANYKDMLYTEDAAVKEFVSSKTGRMTTEADPNAIGNTPQYAIKFKNNAEFLKRLGIQEIIAEPGKPAKYVEDMAQANEWAAEPNAKTPAAIQRNIKETARMEFLRDVAVRNMVLQSATRRINDPNMAKLSISVERLTQQVNAGKSKNVAVKRFSKTMSKQGVTEQREIIKAMRSPEFASKLDSYLKQYKDPKEAVANTMVDFFEVYKSKPTVDLLGEFTIENPLVNVKKGVFREIGRELHREFQFSSKVTAEKLAARAFKATKFPVNISQIERAAGVQSTGTVKNLFTGQQNIEAGQAMSRKVALEMTKKYGEGVYESLFLDGESGGKGIGTYSTIQDMLAGKEGTNRSTVWRSAKKGGGGKAELEGKPEYDAYQMIEGVYKELRSDPNYKPKTFEMSKADSNRQGDAAALGKKIGFESGKELNIEQAKKEYQFGEKNKEVLLDAVELMKDLYSQGELSATQVRQFTEMHANAMKGLIKKAASLAVLPNGKLQDLIKEYGEFNSSNWVLEHITPAQYVKARIYEYVLSKGNAEMKTAMVETIKNHHTTYIPKTKDTTVNRILQEDLPSGHLPGMDPLVSRYILAEHASPFDFGLTNIITNKTYSRSPKDIPRSVMLSRAGQMNRAYETMFPETLRRASKNMSVGEKLKKLGMIDRAISKASNPNAKRKGMSTWDFDDTLARTKSDVLFTTPDGKKGKLNAEQFAERGAELLEQGYKFDFSEFNKVTGGKPGPFLEKALERAKKFGTKDQFILTARAPEAAPAIKQFLDAQGFKLPLENIVGLGNSTAEAKAMWMLKKFSEGYNDMYFADDAMANVKAVKSVLEQLDIKSNVQQAKRRRSADMSKEFNKMIERKTGIEADKAFSGAKARMLGKRRKPQSIVVPGAQDFMGLMQNFMGRKAQGNADRKFFEDNLVKPFAKATKAMNESRQKASEDLKKLYKDLPTVKKKLNKRIPGTAFTFDQAIRSYLWEKAGFEVPEMSTRDLKELTDAVKNDADLFSFAEGLSMIGKGTWSKPNNNWVAETIVSDLFNLNSKERRAEYLEEWQNNIDVIFSPENLNKIEATQGSKFREALEDSIYRMKTGSNRPTGANRLTNQFNNWINGSVGATMFLNMRSAMLQTISATNYINWSFNNPIKAARAFGNQKQYWSDFTMLWNSAMLKQRRAGLEYNVQEAELAAAMAGQKNKAKAAMAWLIKKGFTPTQVADSFAICAGGSTYYRNKIRELIKQGKTRQQAEKEAFLDFQELTETNQQSSRADLISQQQASGLGRTILAWSNTPMQYMRIQEKAARDIINGRGDLKANMSKIAYYGVIQSAIFSALQNALFSYGLDEEDDLDNDDLNSSIDRTVNTVIDSQLRGLGVIGAATSAIRNTVLEFEKQEEKAYDDNFLSSPDHSRTVLQLTSFSPVISSKLRKLYSAGNEWNYNRAAINEMGLDIDNPAIHAGANVIEATTNIPVARFVQKVDNIQGALDDSNQTWQRIAMLMGYPKWQLGVEDTEVEEAKERGKIKIKQIQEEQREAANAALEEENKRKQQEDRDAGKETTCAAISRNGTRCKNKPVGNGAYCTIHQKVEKRDDNKEVQCSHTKKNGKRCKMKTTNKSGKCYYHD